MMMEKALSSSNGFCVSSEKVIDSNATKGVTRSLFKADFFQMVVGSSGTVLSWEEFKVIDALLLLREIKETKSEIPFQNIGLTSTCKARENDNRLLGHLGFEITYRSPTGLLKKLRVVVKCKPLTAKFVDIFADWIRQCGGDLSQYSETFKRISYFRTSDVREVKVMKMRDRKFTDIAPRVYHTECDVSKEIFLVVMEDLTGHVTHFNSIDRAPEIWKQEDIKVVLRDIACFHSLHLGDDVTSLLKKPWICAYSGRLMKQLSGFWRALLEWNHANFPELWTVKRKKLVDFLIEHLDRMWQVMESFPRTLVHYDFTPRNVCIRTQEIQNETDIANDEPPRSSCVYDWEMSTVHVPQHDVVEFLAFALPAECDVSIRENFVHFYKEQLEITSGKSFESKTFLEVFNATCCDYAVHQLCLKTVTHSVLKLPYFERAVHSHLGYLEDLNDRGSLDFLKSVHTT